MTHYSFLIKVLLHFNTVIGCFWSSPTTSTPKPTTTTPHPYYHDLFTYTNVKDTGCENCRIINFNLTALIVEDQLRFPFGHHDNDFRYMDKKETMSIKGNYLSTFKFDYDDLGQATFLYNKAGVFGIIIFAYDLKFVQFTFRQLLPGVTIVEENEDANLLPALKSPASRARENVFQGKHLSG